MMMYKKSVLALLITSVVIVLSSDITSYVAQKKQVQKSWFAFFTPCSCTDTSHNQDETTEMNFIRIERRKRNPQTRARRSHLLEYSYLGEKWNNALQKYAFFVMIADYLSIPDLQEFSLCNSRMNRNLHLELCEFTQYLIDSLMLNFLLKGDESIILSNYEVRQRIIGKIKSVTKCTKIKYLKDNHYYDHKMIQYELYMAHEFLLLYEHNYQFPSLPKVLVDFYLARDKFQTQFFWSNLEYNSANHELLFNNGSIMSNIKFPLFFSIFINGIFTVRFNPFYADCVKFLSHNSAIFHYTISICMTNHHGEPLEIQIHAQSQKNRETHFSAEINPCVESAQIQLIPYFFWLN